MAFHHSKILRQIFENRVCDGGSHAVRPAFEHAGGVVPAWTLRRVADVRVDRRFWILRIAAMRAVPRFIYASFRENRQALSAPARGPHGKSLVAQNIRCSTPRLPVHLAPIFEIAGEKGAKRPRLDPQEIFIELANPNLLRLRV